MRVTIVAEDCVSCGACVVICPCGAIHLAGGSASIDQERCIQCLRCVCKCYTRAIQVEQTEAHDDAAQALEA